MKCQPNLPEQILHGFSSPLSLLYQRHQQVHCVVGQLGLRAPHGQIVDHFLQEISHNPLSPFCVCTEGCAQRYADLRRKSRGEW